ncbi:MAG: glycosyltransferase, partial [Bacteroidales bacterium]|nr:glycosyltransferase [Bacteroidales bacterium]
MPVFKPVVVVVAYNRPRSLERILHSLKRIRNATDVKLVISIDNQAPDNYPVRDIATEFNWPHGEKEVIYQEARLGLRNHILQCAGLSQQYGSVIILEDDLYVSPYFYDYAVQALTYYTDDQEIAGISL